MGHPSCQFWTTKQQFLVCSSKLAFLFFQKIMIYKCMILFFLLFIHHVCFSLYRSVFFVINLLTQTVIYILLLHAFLLQLHFKATSYMFK